MQSGLPSSSASSQLQRAGVSRLPQDFCSGRPPPASQVPGCGPGSSGSERAETYRGAYPFSEPESAALRDLVKREHIALHVDFHAYGQLVLYPWSHTGSPAKDRDRFAAIGDSIASAIFSAHETRYTLMPSVELYPASGVMSDWVYGEADALSFTIELRPKGGIGFVLPPEQIRPTCDEGFAAVMALRTARP